MGPLMCKSARFERFWASAGMDERGGRECYFRPRRGVWTRDMGFTLTRDMGDVNKGHG